MNNTELLQLLKRLLFSSSRNFYHECPDCRENFGKYGHLPDCELAKAINQFGGEEKFQKSLPSFEGLDTKGPIQI